MKFLVNGEEVEKGWPEEATLAGILQAAEDEYVGENEVITGVLVDGQPLTAEKLSLWKDRSVGELAEVMVEAKPRNSFAAQGLRLISERLFDSTAQRDHIVEDMGRGRSDQAMQGMPDYLKVWDAVQQNLASAARLMEIELDTLEIFDQSNPEKPRGIPVTEQIEHLAEQLDQVKSALEAGDLVLLGDILDYEFSDLTDAWHDMLMQLADQFDPVE